MNFTFDDADPENFMHDIRLIDVNCNREFYPKLNYIFIEMPKFKKQEEELDNDLDHWMYILNNLNKLYEIPLSLKGTEVYENVFKIAEVVNLTPEEMNEYQYQLKIQRDNYSVEKAAKNEAMTKGIALGRRKMAKELITALRAEGYSLEKIAMLTKLSIDEVKGL